MQVKALSRLKVTQHLLEERSLSPDFAFPVLKAVADRFEDTVWMESLGYDPTWIQIFNYCSRKYQKAVAISGVGFNSLPFVILDPDTAPFGRSC